MRNKTPLPKFAATLLGLLPILLCLAVIAAIVLPVVFAGPTDNKEVSVVQANAVEKSPGRTVAR